MEELPSVDVLDPEFVACPHPTYARLRAAEPVSRGKIPDGRPAWFVTRYDDVHRVLTDDRRFSTRWLAGLGADMADVSPQALAVLALFSDPLGNDGPEHERLRAPVARAFTPRLVGSMRPFIERRAEELLDAVEQRALDGGERALELIADYAFPLPIDTIMELLGVPADHRRDMRDWSDAMASFDGSVANAETLWPQVEWFAQYTASLMAQKRSRPGHDLLSALATSRELSEEETTKLVFLLMLTGHETTVNLIGNGALALLRHPAELDLVKSDPSRIKAAVEEILRYETSVAHPRPRVAVEDVEIAGVTIERGDLVVPAIVSANRDEDRFAEADALDIGRENNRHLAFGRGAHTCIGAPLGRMEGQVAISTLLRRMPDLALAVPVDEIEWRPGGLILHGLAALPLTF
jgi:cytochrome P450